MTQQQGRFINKVAVINGSGRRGGLGEAIARQLASEGATIVISDLGQSVDPNTPESMIGVSREMQDIVKDLQASGAKASACWCDVRRYDQVQALAAHAVKAHGGLDIWVNNAGIGHIMKPLMGVSPDDWSAVIDVNLTGVFYGIKAAAQVMIAQGQGGAYC